MVTRRISRQEMKRDEFVDLITRVSLMFERNWRQLAFVAGGAAAVVLVGLGAFFWIASSRSQAQAELARASSLLRAPVSAQAPRHGDPDNPIFGSAHARDEAALSALDAAARKGGKTATLAAYYRGVALLRLARNADAEAAFQQALASAEDPVFRGLIRHALATAAAQKGDMTTAEQRFRELVDRNETGYPKDLVLSELAKVLVQEGKTKEANQTLQQLVKEFPDSPLAGEARALSQPQG